MKDLHLLPAPSRHAHSRLRLLPSMGTPHRLHHHHGKRHRDLPVRPHQKGGRHD